MTKKSWKKRLNSPIKPLKLDNAEFLVLLFVTISLMIFFAFQQGWVPSWGTGVLGAFTAR